MWASFGAVSLLSAAVAGANGLPPISHEMLEDLKEGNVSLETIGIYRARLPTNPNLLHDFLLMEVNSIALPNRRVKNVGFITAEKFYANGSGHIHLNVLAEFCYGEVVKKLEYGMEGCGTILMSDLLDILKEHSSAYNLFEDNCWKYAHKTFQKLMKHFAELPGTSNEAKESILGYLEKMPPLKLPSDAYKVGDFLSYKIINALLNPDEKHEHNSPHPVVQGLGEGLSLVRVTEDKRFAPHLKDVSELAARRVQKAVSAATEALLGERDLEVVDAVIIGAGVVWIAAEGIYKFVRAVRGGLSSGSDGFGRPSECQIEEIVDFTSGSSSMALQ